MVEWKDLFRELTHYAREPGPGEQPRCLMAVALPDIDLVVEGVAAKVSDPATLDRLARRYASEGWPAEARDGAITAAYSAPSAGPPPWDLYEITPVSAIGVATAEPYGATRWQLA